MGVFCAASPSHRLLKNLSKSKDLLAAVWGPSQALSASLLRCESLFGVCQGGFNLQGVLH